MLPIDLIPAWPKTKTKTKTKTKAKAKAEDTSPLRRLATQKDLSSFFPRCEGLVGLEKQTQKDKEETREEEKKKKKKKKFHAAKCAIFLFFFFFFFGVCFCMYVPK